MKIFASPEFRRTFSATSSTTRSPSHSQPVVRDAKENREEKIWPREVLFYTTGFFRVTHDGPQAIEGLLEVYLKQGLILKAAAHQPIFLWADKKSSLVGQCAVNSDNSATRSGLVGRNLTVLDLKTSCRFLSASVRWTKTICLRSRAAQPIRKCHESHASGIGTILILNDRLQASTWLVATKNRLVCGKLMARQILTRFDPDKKFAVLRQKKRLVCGSLQFLYQTRESRANQNARKLLYTRRDYLHPTHRGQR